MLGAITDTFERLPGLLVLVPAAIGLRGNVFSALGNRLSTAIHVGNFRLSMRRQTLMGQNVAASLVLTLMLSLLLAVVAKTVAVALWHRRWCWWRRSCWLQGRCATGGTSTT